MAPRARGPAAESGSTPGVSLAASSACAGAGPGAVSRAIPGARATLSLLAAMLAGALAGCANSPAPPAPKVAQAHAPTPAPAEPVEGPRIVSAAASGPEPGIVNPLPTSPSASLSGAATPFATKNALYTPVSFSSVPGWASDDVAQSWEAFRRGCAVLGGKPGWAAPCAAARGINANDSVAVRRFFEDNFTVYQIRNVDKTSRGVLTGYYEPVLRGSRKYGAPYVYPVYGVPRDMVFLDSRRLPPNARGEPVMARIEGRTVIPLAAVSTGNAKGVYALELGSSVPDIRDKKLRLRLEGNRIVPYYSRVQIERGRIDAPVLAYVADPAMLYAMQLQGAGKVVLPDGVSVIRLAYAEQNGFAFNPPVASASTKGRKVLVRGVEIDLEEGNVNTQNTPDHADAFASDDAPQSQLLRGAADADPPGAAAAAAHADASPESPPESPLLRGFNLAKGATPTVRPARVSTSPAATAATSGHGALPSAHAANPPAAPAPSLAGAAPLTYAFASSDPSYVFFRTIPDSPAGPIGALGVPLSPERSAAVDPRTTPLGAPVFIDASEGGASGSPVTRLLMAQDSGGAIRGAVRADYFFGTGEKAQQKASRMKQPTQMWVLLPKGLRISAKESAVRVRGGPAMPSADCVVSDPDLCVDDTQ
ncbi:murein transglycosylase A [Caballeronia ptereochthonis]|uniref:peptidoglycan lytic exotransglycosylase n=1 Tax=Caballeronia ptereochthonis TaxID=1777144 RepID=A0A158A062_9BURK|nr:murein transglycosylase A [Caballeronia ptereochthonis]SAK51202.1 MltA domain-containing protein [Caballeronia ptereochthonis]